MAGHKPIIHGWSDPCAIPEKCRKCTHYKKEGLDYPKCDRREDGKLIPEIGWSCFRVRTSEPPKEKEE